MPAGVPHVDSPGAKEANSIKLPPELPTAVSFRNWKHAVRFAVVSASDRADAAALWIYKVERPGMTVEALADSEGFTTLDTKLASALIQVAKGDLGRKLANMADKAVSQNTILRGRQCLWLIYSHYKMFEQSGVHYNLQSLASANS